MVAKILKTAQTNLKPATLDNGRQDFYRYDDYVKDCSLQIYLQSLVPQSLLTYQKSPVFILENTKQYQHNFYKLDNGCLRELTHYSCSGKVCISKVSSAVVIQNKNPEIFGKAVLLINGDDRISEDLIERCRNFPVVSFDCLSQFYNNGDEDTYNERIIKKLTSKELVVIDYTCSSVIPFTKRQLQANNPKAPLGYTKVGGEWHKSGHVLFHDKVLNQYIIMGQDEGTYFGCELARKAVNVPDALESLIPREAKGKEYQRQGEWFCVPVQQKEVPELSESIATFDTINLPIDDPDSNLHTVNCTYSKYGRISKNNRIFAFNPEVYHDEHKLLNMKKGWYAFYKNTAVRSFSQMGVD